MKKTIFLLVALLTMSASYAGDALTATLQQGDDMKAFYGVDAFKEAYASASDGATITLSAGTFNTVDSVAKSVNIIGTYAFNTDGVERTSMSGMKICADNVKVEGVFFNDVTLGSISNCHIKRCYFYSLYSTAEHTNTLIDQCFINADHAIVNGINYTICNSTIYYFHTMNTTTNMAHITNCVVWGWYSSQSSAHNQPYAVYLNNVLCGEGYENSNISLTVSTCSEFYNNLFIFRNTYKNVSNTSLTFNVTFPNGCINKDNVSGKNLSDYYTSSDYPAGEMKSGTSILGMDGTTVGPWGGIGFSYYPAIPRITSSTIDNATDAEGELNVKISAAAEP